MKGEGKEHVHGKREELAGREGGMERWGEGGKGRGGESKSEVEGETEVGRGGEAQREGEVHGQRGIVVCTDVEKDGNVEEGGGATDGEGLEEGTREGEDMETRKRKRGKVGIVVHNMFVQCTYVHMYMYMYACTVVTCMYICVCTRTLLKVVCVLVLRKVTLHRPKKQEVMRLRRERGIETD